MRYSIRRFEPSDAESLSMIILRNLREVNSRDYSANEIERLAAGYSARDILRISENAHVYVACSEGRIVGCGAISEYEGSSDKAWIGMVFVLPELHGTGVGRLIMSELEGDSLFLRSKKAVLKASVTARGFYERLGYTYANGGEAPDAGMVYRMEKTRVPGSAG